MTVTTPKDRDELRKLIARAIYPRAQQPWREEADAVLFALDKAGLVLCPKEPTPEMLAAYRGAMKAVYAALPEERRARRLTAKEKMHARVNAVLAASPYSTSAETE